MDLNSLYSQYLVSPSLEGEFYSALTEQASSIVRRRLGHRDEDLTQEMVIKAWQEMGKYDSTIAGFSTWCSTVMENQLSDILKSEPGATLVSIDEAANIEALEPSPYDEVYVKEKIAGLPEGSRELVEQVFKGASLEEAADNLGIHLSTAYRRWNTALEELRK